MKKLYLYLCAIVWKDFFKHRWGFNVDLYTMPSLNLLDSANEPEIHPVICCKPVKRPLTQSYNTFVRQHDNRQRLFITGSKSTIKSLGNVGSFQNPNNWKKNTGVFEDCDNSLLTKLLRLAAKYGHSRS